MSLPTVQPLTSATFRSLMGQRPSPCLTIYLPTHRPGPESAADPLAYRNLLDRLEISLTATRSRSETHRLLGPWRSLEHDASFWRTVGDGFAGFASLDGATIVPLDGRVEPMAVVGRRFHTLPIVRRLFSTERCRVVALTSRVARVYVGRVSDYGEERLEPESLHDGSGAIFPDGMVLREAIVEAETVEPHRVMHGMGNLGDAVHGGFGSREEAALADTRRFVRAVAKMVMATNGADRSLPLIVIGLPRVVAGFVEGLPRGAGPVDQIAIDPHALSIAELGHLVGDRMRVTRQRRQADLGERFLEARAHGRASGDFSDIARAAVAGRVEVLVVEEGRREAGAIDRRSGAIEFPSVGESIGPKKGADIEEDLYATLAEIVLEHGGTVLSLPAKGMPTRTGVGAIHRWA